jgi:hypothetical protein
MNVIDCCELFIDGIRQTFDFIGHSGSSGHSGFQGYSGTEGYSGNSGTEGYSGSSGHSGFQGYSGASGYTGAGSGLVGVGTASYYDFDGVFREHVQSIDIEEYTERKLMFGKIKEEPKMVINKFDIVVMN